MRQLLKYTFYRIYRLYQNRLRVKENGHYYSSFALAFLLFGNVFLFATVISLVFFGQIFFEDLLTYFVIVGNILILGVLVTVISNRRYIQIIEEFQNISSVEKERLHKISSGYIVISLASLLAFIAFQILLMR